MRKFDKIMQASEKAVASLALKVGVASSNAVCRVTFYQNKVPAAMEKFKK